MDTATVESLYWDICERGYDNYRSRISERFIGLAHGRLGSEISAEGTVIYLDLSPSDILLAKCVEVILPIAELAFGNRTQLLRAQLTETPPTATNPQRSWHRDLPVDSPSPLSITAIFYLDAVRDAGNTFVIPLGSSPPVSLDLPDEREIAIVASAGDCLVLSGAVWHSGSAPAHGIRRRALILQFGYWWIKQQRSEHTESGELAESVYGQKAPPGDLYITDR